MYIHITEFMFILMSCCFRDDVVVVYLHITQSVVHLAFSYTNTMNFKYA
jgi:hypothetical protein